METMKTETVTETAFAAHLRTRTKDCRCCGAKTISGYGICSPCDDEAERRAVEAGRLARVTLTIGRIAVSR